MNTSHPTLMALLLALSLVSGCSPSAETRDYSDFSVFEYHELPLLSIDARISKVDSRRYTFAWTAWDPDPSAPQNMLERDMTEAEVSRLLEVFSAVDVAQGPFNPNLWFADRFVVCVWDDESYRMPSAWPEMVVSDAAKDEIRSLLHDLATAGG